jgi:hypothetical protein
MLSARRSVFAAGLVVGLACSFDSQSDPMPWTGETEAGSSASESEAGSDDGACDGACDEPPGECFEPVGECDAGQCVYPPKVAFTDCRDDCVLGGHCDTTGVCICSEPDCAATCMAGPHATPSCTEAGECVIECEPPWQDCDGDPATGCEVPVGVPHQCSLRGLDAEQGCWTAYCGAANSPDAIDFGTFHCVDCSTCREPDGGGCQWCNHDTGEFWPVDPACPCTMEHHDAVCG